MRRIILLALPAMIMYCVDIEAQVSIAPGNLVYYQNFNTLSNASNSSFPWTDNLTIPNWYAVQKNPPIMGVDIAGNPVIVEWNPSNVTAYRANNGSSSAIGLYSYGHGPDLPGETTDRALGAVNNDDDTEDIAFGVLFENNSGSDVLAVSLNFNAEQWRRVGGNPRPYGYQRMKVSWSVAGQIGLTPDDLFDNSTFVDLPEATIIASDATTQGTSGHINGNVHRKHISIMFPVHIPEGSQFFLRFLDINASGVDMGLAVDDLQVEFLTTPQPWVAAQCNYPVSAYLDMGIIEDIPRAVDTVSYIVPVANDVTSWETILQHFYDEDWTMLNTALSDHPEYGYELAQFTENTGRTFYILRKRSNAVYYWGTFVIAGNPQNQKLVMQSPHPVDDARTGREAAAIFDFTNARAFIVAGTSRCRNMTSSPCGGSTKACVGNGVTTYKISDVAHVPVSIFQLATVALANKHQGTVFVQLHGFSDDPDEGDPDFYISCGTLNGIDKSVPDYPVMVREGLIHPPTGWDDVEDGNPFWEAITTHVDDDPTLGGRDNIQGRFLNEHNVVCGNPDPENVTNRFLHIEQARAVREQPMYYPKIASALGSAINPAAYVRGIPITADNNTYAQDFNTLANVETTRLWGNNIQLPGWYAVCENPGLFSRYTSDNGAASTGGLYAYGEAGDMALGTLSTPTTADIAYGVLFTNETGLTIASVQLSYRAEQWRGALSASQRVKLSYAIADEIDLSPNGILNNVFTNVIGGDLVSVDDDDVGAMNGNAIFTQLTNIEIPVQLHPGQEIFIRFLDEDVNGGTIDDKAMAIDDVEVTFSTEATPVTWLYFTVSESERRPLLQWGATNEAACERYEIERSTSGRHFQSIASIDCQRSPVGNEYEFIDEHAPRASRIYYRVKQTDFDARTTHSAVRVFNQSDVEWSVFYRDGKVHIDGTVDHKPNHVSVVDFLGRLLCEGQPIDEGGNHYTMSCPVSASSLAVVKLIFESGMRLGVVRIMN